MKAIEFSPYKIFKKNLQNVQEFEELSDISYSLSELLLFKYPKEGLSEIKIDNEKEIVSQGSFSMADLDVKEVNLKCQWLNIEKYAEKTNQTIDVVNELLKHNKLGVTQLHPTTSELLIIYPERFQSKPLEALPAPGKASFVVTMEIAATADFETGDKTADFEELQRKYLSLAHSIGKPEEVIKKASYILNRSCYLLNWISFEVYLRSVFHETISSNPEILFNDKQSEKLSITYKDLYNFSTNLTDIKNLQSKLIEFEILKQEGEGKSVHGIINFLKTKLKFAKDPYEGWYQLKGKRFTTSYQDLIELKEVRNSLIHDAGYPKSDFFSHFPNVPNENGELIIDDEYYLRSKLIIKSIGYNIADLIVNKKYKLSTKP